MKFKETVTSSFKIPEADLKRMRENQQRRDKRREQRKQKRKSYSKGSGSSHSRLSYQESMDLGPSLAEQWENDI